MIYGFLDQNANDLSTNRAVNGLWGCKAESGVGTGSEISRRVIGLNVANLIDPLLIGDVLF